MALGERRLQRVGTPADSLALQCLRGAFQAGHTAGDLGAVPFRAVLVLEKDRLAVGTRAGREPRGLELHQRHQAVDLGLVGHQGRQDPTQTQCLRA